jgi:hypothetical protein
MLIEVAIPGDRKVIKKEAEKILKYKDIIIEIQRMWNLKEPSQNHSNNTSTTYRESTKLSNYRSQPYWVLHTNCGKC